jgi:hypothetical protein
MAPGSASASATAIVFTDMIVILFIFSSLFGLPPFEDG